MDIRVYTDALDLIEKEIKKITMKGEMSPTELVNLKEAVTAACKIVEMVGELPSESTDGMGTSYAVTPGFMHRYSGHPYGEHDSSYRRGRSSMTGRYVSRGGDYSGHSIHDRMIAKLEEMYDTAGSEHERSVVDNAIRMIEQYK